MQNPEPEWKRIPPRSERARFSALWGSTVQFPVWKWGLSWYSIIWNWGIGSIQVVHYMTSNSFAFKKWRRMKFILIHSKIDDTVGKKHTLHCDISVLRKSQSTYETHQVMWTNMIDNF